MNSKDDSKKPVSLYQLDLFAINQLEEESKRDIELLCNKDAQCDDYLKQVSSIQCPVLFEAVERKIQKSSIIQAVSNSVRQFLHNLTVYSPVRVALSTFSILIILGATWLVFQNISSDSEYVGFKGHLSNEILFEIDGKNYRSGEEITLTGNDTISIVYQSADNVYIQMFYSENNGSIQNFSDGDDEIVWDAAAKLQYAPKKLVLEGAWQRQVVWVITSHKFLPEKKAKAILEQKTSSRSVTVHSFYMIQ